MLINFICRLCLGIFCVWLVYSLLIVKATSLVNQRKTTGLKLSIKILVLGLCLTLCQCSEDIGMESNKFNNAMTIPQNDLIRSSLYIFYSNVFLLLSNEAFFYSIDFNELSRLVAIQAKDGQDELEIPFALNCDSEKQCQLLSELVRLQPLLKNYRDEKISGTLEFRIKLKRTKSDESDATKYISTEYSCVKKSFSLGADFSLNGLSKTETLYQADQQIEHGMATRQKISSQETVLKSQAFKVEWTHQACEYYRQIKDKSSSYLDHLLTLENISGQGRINGIPFEVQKTSTPVTLENVDSNPLEPVEGVFTLSIGQHKIVLDFGKGKTDNVFEISIDNQAPWQLELSAYFKGM